MAAYIAIPLAAAAAGLIKILSDDKILQSVDVWNTYYHFTFVHTGQIDRLLLDNNNNTYITTYMYHSTGQRVPGVGHHYYYHGGYYITLTKSEDLIDNVKLYFYLCRVWWLWNTARHNDVYVKFSGQLFQSSENEIQTYHISISSYKTEIVAVRKRFSPGNSTQRNICGKLIDEFYRTRNTAVLLFGEPGGGKSFTARVLKKILESEGRAATNVLLFDDFNPSAAGVDIIDVALQKARPETPVILVIDEIDKHFQKVNSNNNQNIHGRVTYTDSKQSFNNMLDTIRSINDVILIGTSNLDFESLQSQYGTFIRHGRFDHLIEVFKNGGSRNYPHDSDHDKIE
jgi:hypothetical protein